MSSAEELRGYLGRLLGWCHAHPPSSRRPSVMNDGWLCCKLGRIKSVHAVGADDRVQHVTFEAPYARDRAV